MESDPAKSMSARSKLNRVFARSLAVLLFLLLAFCAAQMSFAGMYTYKDDKGKTHFVDALSKIPKQYRKKEKAVRQIPDARKVNPSVSSASQIELPGEVALNGEVKIPLIPIHGGNFLVDVVLNGSVNARLILDTGASIITVSEDIGRQLGVMAYANVAELPFNTAGGEDWMPLVALETVTVGSAKAQLVEAAVNSHMKDIDGLLGMSFLGDFKFEIDQNSNLLTLKPLQGPNDLTWGGKPGKWWKNRFDEYQKNIRNYGGMARAYKQKAHAKAMAVEKVVDYYKDLNKKLLFRASTSGLPDRFRPSS